MALLEIKRAEAERDLRKFCKERVPVKYQDTIRGNDFTLAVERPPLDGRETE